MAGEDNLLSKLVDLVNSFDDASWSALASVGLLRRARKDIERLQIEIAGEEEGSLQIKVPPFVVSIPAAGPVNATCSCPAPDVCQHIIAAGLFLQTQHTSPIRRKPATEDSVLPEVSSLTPEKLKAWAGSIDYRRGLALFERNSLPPLIEYQETVIIRLAPSGIEVRFIPDAGLGGMILPKLHGERAGVAAILALRKSLGLEIPRAAAQQSLVELSGTPRTKKEILNSACALLEGAVAVGLSHGSQVLSQRLITLAVSAQGAQLPSVALALRTVADEVKSILQREARADEDRLLTMIARVYALMDAIRTGSDQETMQLAGTSRGVYVEVPEMELAGVGAYTWQTGSGYIGLTVLFWANQTKEFVSWSYARPEMQRVDARQRFYGEGPWEGTHSPQQVAASRLKLRNGRRTANGRLSSSTKTNAVVLGMTAPDKLDFDDRLFCSWILLKRYAATKQPLGLHQANPLNMVVVLQPKSFGRQSFDPISQTFTWEAYDEAGDVLTLSLPFREWTKESIRTLEQLSPSTELQWRFVVRLTYQNDELLVEPLSILRSENHLNPVFQLTFDSFAGSPGVAAVRDEVAVSPDSPDESNEDQVQFDEPLIASMVPGTAALRHVVAELDRRLLAIAETGTQKDLATHRQFFLQSADDVHAMGLTVLAKSLSSIAHQNATPASVLRTRYLTYLHTQATVHLCH